MQASLTTSMSPPRDTYSDLSSPLWVRKAQYWMNRVIDTYGSPIHALQTALCQLPIHIPPTTNTLQKRGSWKTIITAPLLSSKNELAIIQSLSKTRLEIVPQQVCRMLEDDVQKKHPIYCARQLSTLMPPATWTLTLQTLSGVTQSKSCRNFKLKGGIHAFGPVWVTYLITWHVRRYAPV